MDTKSLAELERRLNILKSNSKNKSRAHKSEIELLKNNINKVYIENKMQTLEFEKTNYEYIVMLKSTRGFYKLFNHSALFYANDIAPKLSLNANLQTDGDFYAKAENGFVSVRDPEKLSLALGTLGIRPVKIKDSTGNFIVFKLPWKFDEKQLLELVENNLAQTKKFNHIVIVDNIIPVLYIQIIELIKAIYENVRGMGGPVEREAFGYESIKVAAEMNHIYINMANGKTSRDQGLNKIKTNLNFLKAEIKLLADLKIWTPKVCARIGDIIIKLQEILERELRRDK